VKNWWSSRSSDYDGLASATAQMFISSFTTGSMHLDCRPACCGRSLGQNSKFGVARRKRAVKWGLLAVAVLTLPAQIDSARAEFDVEAAYALLSSDEGARPMPAGGYEKKQRKCSDEGRTGCFYEKSFQRLDDCRYLEHAYVENDPENPGKGVASDWIIDFNKAKRMEFRNVSTADGKHSVPGRVIVGEAIFLRSLLPWA
jgi:hypothetical protein